MNAYDIYLMKHKLTPRGLGYFRVLLMFNSLLSVYWQITDEVINESQGY